MNSPDQAQPSRGRAASFGRAFRRFRRHCWKFAAWFVIASAVVVSIGRLLAPYADTVRPVLEQFLSNALGQQVAIRRVEASWPRLSPQIELRGLTIGDADAPLLTVDQAQLELRLYNLVRPAHNSFELAVLGLELAVIQDETGRWSWELERGGRFAEGWERAVAAGDLVLRDSGVRVAPRAVPELRWTIPEATLNRVGDQLRVRFAARAEDGADELDARLLLEMPDSRLKSLRAFAESPNFALTHLAFDDAGGELADLRTQMKWWVEWSRTDGGRLHGRVDLHSLAASGVAGTLSSRFELDGVWHGGEWKFELNAGEFGESEPNLIRGLGYGRRQGRQALVADRVRLDYLHALIKPWLGFFEVWPDTLSGTATGLRLGIGADGSFYRAEGELADLAVRVSSPQLAVEGIDLALHLSGDQLVLRAGGAPRVEYPLLYPAAIEFSAVSGGVRLGRDRLGLDGLMLTHPELAVRVDGEVLLRPAAPFLDLVVDLPRLGPTDPRDWLPERGIAPKTRNWLEDALVALQSGRARTTLFGDPTRWKDRIAPGALNSIMHFSGLELAYARNWPVAENAAGRVEFHGESLTARVERAIVAGAALSAPRVHIAQLRDAEVELELESLDGDAGRLASLARVLPVIGVAGALARMEWSGDATAAARVWLPVKHRRDWRLIGSVEFADTDFELPDQGISVLSLNGEMPFSRAAIGPSVVRGRVRGEAVELALEASLEGGFDLRLSGELPARGLIPASWSRTLPGVVDRVSGRAGFDLRFARLDRLGDRAGNEAAGFGMRLASNLDGVALDLPQPLAKPAGTAWPLELVLPLAESPEPLRFDLDGRFSGELLLGPDFWQLGMGLGGVEARLPVAENFFVEGSLEALQLDEWIGLVVAGAGDSGSASAAGGDSDHSGWLNVSIADLRFGQASLGRVELALGREAEYWRLRSAGENLEGSIRFPATRAADRDVVIDLARLHWPVVERDEPESLSPPMRTQPEAVPAFDIAVRDLQWGDLDLGELRFTSHKSDRGLEIEQVSTEREGLEIAGSGAWLGGAELAVDGRGDEGVPRTRMRVRVAADNLGRALAEAGFDLALEGGRAVIEFDGSWPGSPVDFALQRTSGRLDLVISDGAIPAAKPGAGRLLGLVSLNSIPRRLRLDFSDVFGEGLGFDRLAGRFELDDGIARTTEDLRIDAPAAEIRLRGTTDLRERTYDQTLIVRPGLSATLPIIGALAGGPVGAAAGAALQQIFSRPLRGVTEIRYSVTGPWDNPVIEPIDSDADSGRERKDG
ncbi:MAG: AsmA-like C-terminal region-containing protein [Wenzhouxiangellaceae bacterium]|nr:AsmA-like C-terminal region-containing protein [Wenzhouxiangellaceae bacterium]